MPETKRAYITQNWFKSIFLQLYLDYRRGRVFAEAKKRNEWKCPDDLMTFEENCFVTNEEILSSFGLILKEEMLYDLISPEEAQKILKELRTALDTNERERYIQMLAATGEYPESTGVFSFSSDWNYLTWPADKGETFHAAFRTMITAIQNGKRLVKHPLNLADHFGFFLFLNLLPQDGFHLDIPYRSHPLPGIGKSHTHLSLTDPGRGHRQGTVMKRAFFEPNYVHVEHLERLGRTRKEIESYRIPNILDFALTRACVGDLAPVTAYLGRPLCEYSGAFDLLKASNLTSAAAGAFFAMGAAEIKLAIDPLTITQAMAYLNRLMTLRGHPRQSLSVAFNLNREYIDDRIPGQTKVVQRKLDIGMLGIDMVCSAGWDKITWDGAGDIYPSVCVMDQISPQDALTLVHTAHERGLTTYFSGGFVIGKGHIQAAVFAGVDGIGIGGAQVLRLIDKSGHEGPFLEENLDIINKERDDAEATVRGKAARLLACLDRLYFEGSLPEELEPMRQNLFGEMKAGNESALARMVQTSESFDLPIGTDYKEYDYELWVCRRVAAAGNKGIAYTHGNWQTRDKADQALKELREKISRADDIPTSERRIYYTDVIRHYKDQAGWPPAAQPLRCKFFLFTQKKAPEIALERAS
jgi:hypothetical protein